MYRILTHYVMMETYEVPDNLVILNAEAKIEEDETFQKILESNEDYVVKADGRDWEIVDWEYIEDK